MSQASANAPTPTAGRTMATVRAVVFVALLTGNLFPTVAGVSIATAAAVVAAPLIGYELLRYLPRLHPAVPFCLVVFLPLVLVGIMSEPITPYGEEKFGKIVTSLLLSAMAVVLLRDRRHLTALAWVWLSGSLILAAASIVGIDSGSRAVGFGSNPIWLGRELVSGVLVALWLAWRRKLNPVLTLGATAVLVSALVSTESRGPLLGALVAVVAFLVIVRPRVGEVTVALVCFTTAVAIGVLWFARGTVPGRMMELLIAPGESFEQSRRGDFWETGLSLMSEYPGGIGYGQWGPATGLTMWPHNLFLEVFVEAGWIPGVVIVGITAWVLVRLLLRVRTEPAATLVALLLIASTVEVSLSGDLNARTFFALLVLGWCVPTWPRDDQSEPSDTHVPGEPAAVQRQPLG